MSHRGHGGKSPTPGLSPPFPPRLENPANDAGFSTFPQGTAAGLTIPLPNQTGNPKNLNLVNSRGLPLSCGERKFPAAILATLVTYCLDGSYGAGDGDRTRDQRLGKGKLHPYVVENTSGTAR